MMNFTSAKNVVRIMALVIISKAKVIALKLTLFSIIKIYLGILILIVVLTLLPILNKV